MNLGRFTLAVAAAGVALALGAGIQSHIDVARLNARFEQFELYEHKLAILQDAINTEQEDWDEKAAEKLEQETEANQL